MMAGMPNKPATQHRSVRVEDAEWSTLHLNAPGGDRSAVIKTLITWYNHDGPLPDRPHLRKASHDSADPS